MKRRKKNPPSLLDQFESTCSWCGKHIPPNTPVYGGSAKAREGIDLLNLRGQVIPLEIVTAGKTILIAVVSEDSEARREGHDFMYMACSKPCAMQIQEALQADIDLLEQSG